MFTELHNCWASNYAKINSLFLTLTPLGELTALPQTLSPDPLAGGERAGCPPLREPHPPLRPFGSRRYPDTPSQSLWIHMCNSGLLLSSKTTSTTLNC